MSALLPDGITHLGEAPYTLHQAILTALRILSYGEFPNDERPPKRIWMDGPRLEEHWKRIEHERNRKYGLEPKDAESNGHLQENAVELIKRG